MNSTEIGDALQAGQIPAIPDSLPLDLQRMLRQCFSLPNTRTTAAVMALKRQVLYLVVLRCFDYIACCCAHFIWCS